MPRWLDNLSFLAHTTVFMHKAVCQMFFSALHISEINLLDADAAVCRRLPYGGTTLCTNFWTCTAAPARSSSLPSSGTGHSRYDCSVTCLHGM